MTLLRAFLVSLCLLLAVAIPARAGTVLTGKVRGAAGYTLIGVAKTGKGATHAPASSGAFKLRFRGRAGRGATLHLIRPDGRYFGPVRLHRKGRRAYVRLSGRSGSLGTVRLLGDFAAPRRVARKLVDLRRVTKASSSGKPLGAGRLGLVRGSAARSAQAPPPGEDGPAPLQPPSGDQALGADPDADGLTNNFDIDDNGNGTLDATDPAAGPSQNQPARVFVNLKVNLQDSLNANGAPVSGTEIDRLLMEHLWPVWAANGDTLGLGQLRAVNVDCFELAYCRPGDGTATIFEAPRPTTPAGGSRWVDFDPDGDGLPNLAENTQLPGANSWEIGVRSRVPRDQISPEDTFSFRAEGSEGASAVSTTLGPYFVTTPGIKSFDDGHGAREVSYPPKPGDPGTNGGNNDIQLRSEKVTFTFWRPQREAIAGAESGEFVDIGGLRYVAAAPGTTTPCPVEDYSNLSPGLEATGQGFDAGVTDRARDAAPSPANTLSFTIDFGQCLRRQGIDPAQCGQMGLEARTARGENAAQGLWVRMPGARCEMPGPPPPDNPQPPPAG